MSRFSEPLSVEPAPHDDPRRRGVADTGGRVRYVADAVVTMDGRRSVHRPGVVEVEGDRIVAVGPPPVGSAPSRPSGPEVPATT